MDIQFNVVSVSDVYRITATKTIGNDTTEYIGIAQTSDKIESIKKQLTEKLCESTT